MVGQNHVLNGLIMALIVSSTAIKFLIWTVGCKFL